LVIAQANIKAWSGMMISGHSLRAGFITEADKAGIPDHEIMAHTRHVNRDSLRDYVRRLRNGDASPAGLVGL
jgi:hypothetical protein